MIPSVNRKKTFNFQLCSLISAVIVEVRVGLKVLAAFEVEALILENKRRDFNLAIKLY